MDAGAEGGREADRSSPPGRGGATVAVTGATGFVGRALCTALAERGDRVRAFVRRDDHPFATTVQTIPFGGLDDLVALRRGCDGADAVVHLAARVHVLHESAHDAEARYHAVNVTGTEAVLQAAHAGGVRHVVLASSVKAVGEGNTTPWTEDVTPVPSDPYARSKLEAERVALAFGARHGITVTVLRLPLVYGPGAAANVLRLVALVRRGWPLPLGAVRNRRSMISRSNVVAAIVATLDTGAGAQGVFFASDGVDLSTPELIRTIARAAGRPARLIPVPLLLLRAVGRFGDVVRRVVPFPLTSAELSRLTESLTVDTARLRAATGFTPPETPEEGWRRTVEWYTRNAT